MTSLLVMISSSGEIDASVLGVSSKYCENLCTNQNRAFASGLKHLAPSGGWHPTNFSSMCLGRCVATHFPAFSAVHGSIVLLI